MKYIIYFILCVLQPICLPVPELTTYLFGEKTIGSMASFLIGLLGVMIGISIMYFISYKMSNYIINKKNYREKITKLAEYVKKYRILIIGFLFIIPVLPDEIICIGSPIIGINFLLFIIIAFISKAITIASLVFSNKIGLFFGLNQTTIIIIEILLCIITTIIFNFIDKKRKK